MNSLSLWKGAKVHYTTDVIDTTDMVTVKLFCTGRRAKGWKNVSGRPVDCPACIVKAAK